MAQETAKIFQFEDALKCGGKIANEDIQDMLVEERTKLRQLDDMVIELLAMKHTLKQAEIHKDITVIIEKNLLLLSDWLEDKIAEEKREVEKAEKKELKAQCDTLMARNERIKKNLADDMAARRYYEGPNILNPVQVGSLVITATMAGIGIAKGIFDAKPPELIGAAGGGVAVSAGIAFYRQIGKAFKDTADAIVDAPRQVRDSFTVYYAKKGARNTAASMAWAFSVYAKRLDKTELPEQEPRKAVFAPEVPKLRLVR